ncbi:protein of unknown function [Ralstonia solanacearum CMR15]|nr:protein of unknown function [Ralstonia solanacearum CMR15]
MALPPSFLIAPPKQERPYASLPDKQGQAPCARVLTRSPAGLRLPCATLHVWLVGWREGSLRAKHSGRTAAQATRHPTRRSRQSASGLDI